jgi:hypothetical protein
MYETYPKGSKHPSMKVGEQDSKESWNAPSKTSYNNTTVKDTVYNGDTVKTKSCDGGHGKAKGSSQVSCTYPGKRAKFPSES